MGYSLKDKLVVAVASRALFDLEIENQIYETEGLEAYTLHQIEHETELLRKGTAYPLVEMLLNLNQQFEAPIVEVIVLSRNSPETGLRVFNTIEGYGIDIQRAAFTGGENMALYLKPFEVDLFLSKNELDVQEAIDAGFAAALIYDTPIDYMPDQQQIRIAFDADAVLFSEDSELIYKTKGLDAFKENERALATEELKDGPFARLIRTLSKIKDKNPDFLRIAIVTARNSPAHKRVILTLRKWGVKVDEAFFLGGVNKDQVLKAFNAHIFFDDQDSHVRPASEQVPSGRVPYKSDSLLNQLNI